MEKSSRMNEECLSLAERQNFLRESLDPINGFHSLWVLKAVESYECYLYGLPTFRCSLEISQNYNWSPDLKRLVPLDKKAAGRGRLYSIIPCWDHSPPHIQSFAGSIPPKFPGILHPRAGNYTDLIVQCFKCCAFDLLPAFGPSCLGERWI